MKGLMDKTMTDRDTTGKTPDAGFQRRHQEHLGQHIPPFNAAMGATRAGGSGRRDATVVASGTDQNGTRSQTRNQLERVMKDASGSLAGAIKAMGEVIGHVASFGEYVGEVATRANELISTNRGIQEEILAIKNNSEEITIATQEQNRAAREVSSTIERINEATQHISGATNDIIDDAHQLSRLASELTASADHQRAGEGGGAPQSPA